MSVTYTPEQIQHYSDRAGAILMRQEETKASRRGGWMMIATILIEAWDLYAISFLLNFIKDEFKPDAVQTGFITAAVQFGALLGAIFGGYIADKLGRRRVFLLTMALFIVLAVAQAFAFDATSLIILRVLIGIPLGSDISNGYAYIMESMPAGSRERMGSLWQFMFAVGEVACALIVLVMYIFMPDHHLLWRVGLAMGAIPAIALLLGRLDMPETPASLIQAGKFHEAKQVSMKLFNEPLDFLPDADGTVERPKVADFLRVIWADPIKRRGSIFGWISNACQGAEFAAFGFYLPVILATAGVGVGQDDRTKYIGTMLVTAAIYTLAGVSGWFAPKMMHKTGHRGLSSWGFGLAFIGLVGCAMALSANMQLLIVFFACLLMWGHYWDASNGMTIVSLVAPARFKATASGFGYIFVKAASFFGAFGYPVITDFATKASGSKSGGQMWATLAVSLLSLTGFLAARFILPELYGYVEGEHQEEVVTA